MANKKQDSTLKELVELYKSGAINKEEFDMLKKTLPDSPDVASKETTSIEESISSTENEKAQPIKEKDEYKKEKVTKKQGKSPNYLIYILFSITIIALTISLVSLFEATKERDNLLKEQLKSQLKIKQLSEDLASKSDALNETNKKLLTSSEKGSTSSKIPIPDDVKRKISILKRSRPNWFTDEIEFHKIGNGAKYELRVIDGWDYSTFILADLYSDKWTFNIPGQGSGGGEMNGTILFTVKGILISSKRTSCAGATDCYEYSTVTYNNSTVHQLRTAL